MRRRITDSLLYWAPGLISIVALLATVAFGLDQERKIGRLEGKVHSNELRQMETESLRTELNQLKVEMMQMKNDTDFEAAKTQNLRERLIKKGWIE